MQTCLLQQITEWLGKVFMPLCIVSVWLPYNLQYRWIFNLTISTESSSTMSNILFISISTMSKRTHPGWTNCSWANHGVYIRLDPVVTVAETSGQTAGHDGHSPSAHCHQYQTSLFSDRLLLPKCRTKTEELLCSSCHQTVQLGERRGTRRTEDKKEQQQPPTRIIATNLQYYLLLNMYLCVYCI